MITTSSSPPIRKGTTGPNTPLYSNQSTMKHHPVEGSKGFPSTTMGASSPPKAIESKRRMVNGVDPARGTKPTKPHDVVTETTRKVNVRRSADSSPKEKPKVKEERKRVVGCRGPEKVVLERSKGGLKQRLEESDTLVGLLKVEVLGLKKNLEELQTKNGELEEQNRRYRHDLAAAEAKIQSYEISNLDKSVAEKVNKSESIDDRLEKSEAEKKQKEEQACKELTIPMLTNLTSQSSTREVVSQPEVQTSDPIHLNPSPIRVPPPPPPPPPPTNAPKREAAMQKSPSLVEFYRSLTKRGRENSSPGIASCSSSVVNKAHNSVVGEIQNRSTHLLKIKEDVETKGEFINSLISKVQLAAFADIEEVSDFIEWLDLELSTLSDERAVLKHFSWPEKKADAMREAAFEYRALKRLQVELGTYEDEISLSFDATLKKMENLLDKLDRSTQRLSKLRDGAITSYGLCKIPTDWMLDSGIINKVKLATMKLAKICMKRVPVEVESMRHSEKEMFQEALLLQCVRFSYRVHQFAGGLDMETMSAFEELRRRINGSNVRESRELLPGIAVS